MVYNNSKYKWKESIFMKKITAIFATVALFMSMLLPMSVSAKTTVEKTHVAGETTTLRVVDLFSRWKTDSYGMDGNVKRNGVEYVASPEIKLYCTGGLFNSQSNIFTGAAAERFIESMYADMVFFSSQAISADGEISDVSEEETALRKKCWPAQKRKFFFATLPK